MYHRALIVPLLFAVGCAAKPTENQPDSLRSDTVLYGTRVDGNQLEDYTPVRTFTPEEFMEYLLVEIGVPEYEDGTPCDSAIADLNSKSFKIVSIEKHKVVIEIPQIGSTQAYYFPGSTCSE